MARVQAPPGYAVEVNPRWLRLAAGESATYEVTITNQGAPLGEWRFGALAWKDKSRTYSVRSPIAVRGSLFAAPELISGIGESGSSSFDVGFGYEGAYTAAGHGLVGPAKSADAIGQDPDQTYPSADDDQGGVQTWEFSISGAAFARFQLVVPGPDDIDLYLEDSAGNIIASSTNAGTDELIELTLPADDTYTLVVHGWLVPNAPLDYTLSTWIVPLTTGGSLVVDSAPAAAELGATGTVELSWSGLVGGAQSFGAVSHSDETGLIGLTLVEVVVP
jgi:hypothetical protein